MRTSERHRRVSSAVVVYIVVLRSMQVFLATVAAEAVLEDNEALGWATAGLSTALFLGAAAFLRYLRP